MVNIKPQILALLKTITGVKVNYFYPEDFAALPAISYYELSNTTKVKADGQELLSEIHIQVDAWAKTSSEASSLADKIDTQMTGKGFYREMSMDLYEPDTKIHHKTMRYRGTVNNKTQLVTR